MNDNAKAWVAALRSGKYEQGRGYLKVGNLFCCLGVACDIAVKNGVDIEVTDTSYDGETKVMPEVVTAWLGLRNEEGYYETRNDYNLLVGKRLTIDNDDGKTFEEIADIIESEPKGLFA